MPPSANLRNSNQFDFDSFIQNTYMKGSIDKRFFIERFSEEIPEAYESSIDIDGATFILWSR